jgi:hypothetical protein
MSFNMFMMKKEIIELQVANTKYLVHTSQKAGVIEM